MADVSFQKDIVPMFNIFRDQMMWRLDITDYTAVKANAALIYSMIVPSGGMPPDPFDPFTPDQVKLFHDWMHGGCQP